MTIIFAVNERTKDAPRRVALDSMCSPYGVMRINRERFGPHVLGEKGTYVLPSRLDLRRDHDVRVESPASQM